MKRILITQLRKYTGKRHIMALIRTTMISLPFLLLLLAASTEAANERNCFEAMGHPPSPKVFYYPDKAFMTKPGAKILIGLVCIR